MTSLVPKFIKRSAFNFFKRELLQLRIQEEDKIPKYNFTDQLLLNARLLPTRLELLKLLPENGIVAELGVDQGRFSKLILKECKPKKLHLVDFWGTNRYNQKKRKLVEETFNSEIKSGKIEINLGLSVEVVSEFSDKYFDWVYIDTGHSYKVTYQELVAYRNKVKENGILAGHDFVRWSRDGFSRFGVMEAVSEFCIKYDWELIYLTMENDNNPSFAIKSRG
ncbi:class I SAM-dependent methyltransferase [Marivirga aurantiaca]|nr:class I SAM-dependent methyltransferase [Marivirga aurantiaca]